MFRHRIVESNRYRRWLRFESLEHRLVLAAAPLLAASSSHDCPMEFLDGASSAANPPSSNLTFGAEGLLESDSGRAAEAVNQFAYELYRHFQASEGNLFLSPLSISMALAMTYAGARGETAEQMAQVLRLGSEPGIHESFGSLMNSLIAGDRPYDLAIANALWPQIDFPFYEDFLRLIETNYGSQSQALDYTSDPNAARDVINAWVAEQTRDKIQNLLQDLDQSTRMVLTNAIYFKGKWASEFNPTSTSSRSFHRATNDVVDVPMMAQTSMFRYSVQDGFRVLEMPYEGNDLSMVVLLPDAEHSVDDLSASTLSNVSKWLDQSPATKEVTVVLPKFKTTVASKLNDVLKGMGMPRAFDERHADLSGMAELRPDERLFISQVAHKAFVEVNEEGTEAAAATAVAVGIACFAAGTPIRTPSGHTMIEQLRVGDLVLARDEHHADADVVPRVIEEVFSRQSEIVQLHMGGQIIRTTKEHPFFVKTRGWTKVGDLQPKDLLATENRRWMEVEQVVPTGEIETVYNMRVADDHTYFVGRKEWEFAVWAHNICGPQPVQFIADRPFHFLIRDNATATTLFMGRLSDPLQNENQLEPQVSTESNPTSLQTLSPNNAKLDENGDGFITPLDVLVMINHLNSTAHSEAVMNAAWESPFDNNADGVVSGMDVLMLINWLNAHPEIHEPQNGIGSLLDDSGAEGEDDSLSDALDLIAADQCVVR